MSWRRVIAVDSIPIVAELTNLEAPKVFKGGSKVDGLSRKQE